MKFHVSPDGPTKDGKNNPKASNERNFILIKI